MEHAALLQSVPIHLLLCSIQVLTRAHQPTMRISHINRKYKPHYETYNNNGLGQQRKTPKQEVLNEGPQRHHKTHSDLANVNRAPNKQ